jgi:hypothetical protein
VGTDAAALNDALVGVARAVLGVGVARAVLGEKIAKALRRRYLHLDCIWTWSQRTAWASDRYKSNRGDNNMSLRCRDELSQNFVRTYASVRSPREDFGNNTQR